MKLESFRIYNFRSINDSGSERIAYHRFAWAERKRQIKLASCITQPESIGWI